MSELLDVTVKQKLVEYILWYLEGKINLTDLVKMSKKQKDLLPTTQNSNIRDAIESIEKLHKDIKERKFKGKLADVITNTIDDIMAKLLDE